VNYFFDIGANSGQAFDWFLCQTDRYDGCEVFLFEPSPRSLPVLMEKAKAMSSRFNVTILPFAVASASGTGRFNESVDSLCDSLQPRSLHNDLYNRPNKESGYNVIVATVSLSRFILDHTKPGDSIVMKLDAEGSEYGIIQDLLDTPEALRRISEAWIEWHWISPDQKAERELEQELMRRLNEAGCVARIWPY